MAGDRTTSDCMAGIPATDERLHLVLPLDLIQESHGLEEGGISRLENVRNCLPAVTVTFFTDLKVREAMRARALLGTLRPDHLLVEAGKGLLHRQPTGAMELDPDYQEWLDLLGESGAAPGALQARGVEYLEMNWGTPRPLMVAGRPEVDAPVLGLADIPVLLEPNSSSGKPARRTCRAFHLGVQGLSGVVRLLLAHLSCGQTKPFKPCVDSDQAIELPAQDRHKAPVNAWRIQPRRKEGPGLPPQREPAGGSQPRL